MKEVWGSFEKSITASNSSNRATVHWSVNQPTNKPYIHYTMFPSPSKDIEKYEIDIRIGSHRRKESLTGAEMEWKSSHGELIELDVKNWFNGVLTYLETSITVKVTDKRGKSASTTTTRNDRADAREGNMFSRYEVQYLPTNSKSWRVLTTNATGTSYGRFDLEPINGAHRFSVRGYSSTGGWSDWVNSPWYNLIFQGPPPGEPVVTHTKSTMNRIDFSWSKTSNTEWYTIYYRQQGKEVGRVWRIETNEPRASYFSGLDEGAGFTIYVRAHNKDFPGGTLGTLWARTKKRSSSTYYPTGHATRNEQSYMPNTSHGYYRPSWDGGSSNNWTEDRPHWKTNSGTLYQGHWRETDWAQGKSSEWHYVVRSGGYRAADGQSHGNNATLVYMDYNKIRNDLKDAEITSVTISMQREDSVHGFPSAKPVYLYNHNQEYSSSSYLNHYDWFGDSISYNHNPSTASNSFNRGGYADLTGWKINALGKRIIEGQAKGFSFIKYYSAYFHNTVHRGAVDYMRLRASSFSVTYNYIDY